MSEDVKSVPESTSKSKSTRFYVLDWLRGLAVILMIEQHVGIWLWAGPEPGKTFWDYPVLLGLNALGGGAAPLFVVLAATGSVIFLERYPTRGNTLRMRGIVVLAMGFLLSLLTPTWFGWRSWFVLHLLGVAIFASPWLARLPKWALNVGIGVVLAGTVVGQTWLETPSLNNYRMQGWANAAGTEVLAGDIFRLATFEGHFPLFPWLAFVFVGVLVGRELVAGRALALTGWGMSLIILGVGLSLVGFYGPDFPVGSWQWRLVRFSVPFYPASPSFVLLLAGLVIMSIRTMFWVSTSREIDERNLLVVMGRASLTLLFLHVVLIREGLHAIEMWQMLPAGISLAMVLSVIMVAAFWCRLWQLFDYRFGFEWLLRKVAG